MSGARRFFAMIEDNNIFRFKIDTTKIVASDTNGSQLDTQYILPIPDSAFNISSFNLIVSDGRPNVVINSNNISTARVLTFATPGIYEITLLGKSRIKAGGSNGVDVLKIIEVTIMGRSFEFNEFAFDSCSNMIWNVPFCNFNTLSRVFLNIKGISDTIDLGNSLVDSVTTATNIMGTIGSPPRTLFSGFFKKLTSADAMYINTNLSRIESVQIISPVLQTVSRAFQQTSFRGRIVVQSEVLTNITNICYGYTNPPSLGEVDIRRVTSAGTFISQVMSTTNVNATLLGWVNNFDWSVIPTVTNKVTLDFFNSKYSNDTAVINAKAFLESKGIVFTRLTMV